MSGSQSASRAKVLTTTSRVNPAQVVVSPDPGGNRAQRRAWKKLTKKSPKSTLDSSEDRA